MNRWGLAMVALLALVSVAGRSERFRVMTYNVENLFDTCHDEGHDDYEFLPTAERRWDSRRYWAKQGRLCRTIVAAGGDRPADLVGLCEVENDSVVRDLCHRTKLTRMGYDYVVTRSRDSRGIDVALLYQPLRFRPVSVESLAAPYDAEYGRPTRDVLHVAGRLQTGDTLDVFVCHWPSRRGGAPVAGAFRMAVARDLRRRVDSVMHWRQRPQVVLMGDFNDEWTDLSIAEGLRAGGVPDDVGGVEREGLYVLSANLRAYDGIAGTYKYRGRWNQLDQVVINGALLRGDGPAAARHDGRSSLSVRAADCRIFAPAFLLQPDDTHGGVQPRRTYLGPIYKGGFSDHLPLVVDFEL